jgi:hypothetical protein
VQKLAKIYSIYLTSEENEQMDKLIKELNVPPSHVLRMGIQALYEKIVLLQEPQPTPEKHEKPKEKPNAPLKDLLKGLGGGST